jgi:6-hydroxynicotinate reductase
MADVTKMPSNSFGYVPTPAIVAPIEFTMRLEDYRALGGHMEAVVPLEEALVQAERRIALKSDAPWPMDETNFRWGA